MTKNLAKIDTKLMKHYWKALFIPKGQSPRGGRFEMTKSEQSKISRALNKKHRREGNIHGEVK